MKIAKIKYICFRITKPKKPNFMKKLFLSLSVLACGYLQAQSDKYWAVHKETTNKITATDKAVARLSFPKVFDLYDLNTNVLRNTLFSTFKPLIKNL